jgi:hypothetical protein
MVLNRLEKWLGRVDHVRRMFGHEYPEVIQSAYRGLKKDLQEEAHALKLVRREPLTDADLRFYDRPIRHAAAHMTAPTNASPEKIRESVFEAHSDLVLGISKLRQRINA